MNLNEKIEIRCKKRNCNRLFMNYYVIGRDIELHLEGFEMKCEKCKRILRLKNCSEKFLIEHSDKGVFRV